MKIEGKEFEVTNKDKVYYPEGAVTKLQVMEYYEKIADNMLPHLQNRPLSMLRYPDGIEGKKFFQKDAPDYFPEWIKTEKIDKKEGGTTNYVICNDKATLVYLAGQASLTPHIWLSRISDLEKPDKIIFDLDPSDDDFGKVKFAAEKLHDFFANELEVPVYAMTTGSRGIHVVVPIKPELEFDIVLKLTQAMAEHLSAKFPDKFTTETRKNKRGTKIYLDVMRNARGQTAVAPYSLRAQPHAPIATPITWDELSGLKSAQKYNLSNIFNRLGQKEDPWKNIYKEAVSVKKLKETFESIKKD